MRHTRGKSCGIIMVVVVGEGEGEGEAGSVGETAFDSAGDDDCVSSAWAVGG